jgi:hypothetical protein
MVQIIDGEVVTRKRAGRVVIYFIQAQTLKLIKIGLAENVETRVRKLALSSPDRLQVLGMQHCDRGGLLEAELHQTFAAHRAHGEWFHPDKSLTNHILCFASDNRAYLDKLNDIADFPTMKRGRPTKRIANIRALAGITECG